MRWHELVFSAVPKVRYRRHVFFWLAWLVYFTGSFFYKQQPLIKNEWELWILVILLKSTFLLVGHAFICYSTIYLLLPQFLLKGRYFSFTSLLLSAGLLVTAWTYLCYDSFFPLLDVAFHSSTAVTPNTLLWNSILAGLLSSLKLVAVAITIKILKRWWQKQKENMQLEKEKIRVELQLLKAQIHPDFLFSSLDNIYEYAKNNSIKASESLLKLSDMLSYMLYECDQPFVPLQKEIKMIRDYLELEKKRFGGRLDMDIQIIGEPADSVITPLLLLPFIENSLQYCKNKNLEKQWINLDMRINEQYFSLKLINGKSEVDRFSNENRLNLVQKRLEIFYKDNYELKITTEADFMITFLKMQLDKPNELRDGIIRRSEKSNGQNHPAAYATV
jgi:sensor histidine kinase YesM